MTLKLHTDVGRQVGRSEAEREASRRFVRVSCGRSLGQTLTVEMKKEGTLKCTQGRRRLLEGLAGEGWLLQWGCRRFQEGG